MAKTRKTKTSADIEQEIKALQEKLAKAKQRESKNRFSVETRKRLNAIMENHNVKLSDAEINVIVNPCENAERLYFLKCKDEV